MFIKHFRAVSLRLRILHFSTFPMDSNVLLNRWYQRLDEQTTSVNPHPGLIIASHHFQEPYPLINDVDLLCMIAMDLLIQYVYPYIEGYCKLTISLTMIRSYVEDITFTLGNAIPMAYKDSTLMPKEKVYAGILSEIGKYTEIYEGDLIKELLIRVYIEGKKQGDPTSIEERARTLLEIIEESTEFTGHEKARMIINRKLRSYSTHIKALKPYSTELKPFLVADTETIMIENAHMPYAAGLLIIRPNQRVDDLMIETFFSEDYSLDSFEDRSTKTLYDFIKRIEAIVSKEQSMKTIYFHNFSRFDGILVLKHLACHHNNYKLKPLMRNHRIYEVSVYSGNNMLFRFRDSLNLLPGKLVTLAKNLCPELGTKGSIPYEEMGISNLVSKKKLLIDYMKQDILLLGGIMLKAQEIYWNHYKVDIESKITLSSLALSIFRLKYYDSINWPIHIPNKNEDSFIRRGYYGGHTDTYKPYGENLYYYDVNSLYPFVMKKYPMPGGVPVWHRNLNEMNLDSMCGFIEAYVACPKNIKKPFLPYRNKDSTLIFPTGEFVGVYYSEELKYAKSLGYTVLPISGYLFELMESPFQEFVNSLFKSRQEAKKQGNEAMSFVYKILMNSLYGRFGINPKSTITVICDEEKYKDLLKNSHFIFGDKLHENNYIVAYLNNADPTSDSWTQPKNSAVQLAAAITSCSRIHMYPYISREDSYYTDTDSVVLGNPLPDELISSVELGMFKLEDIVIQGFFLAPKCYYYTTKDNTNVLKYKGPAKKNISPEWFVSQFADPSRTEHVPVASDFRIDWHTLSIVRKETLQKIGIKEGSKRIPIYDKDAWVDTEPISIQDFSCLDHTGQIILKSFKDQVETLLKDKTDLLSTLNHRSS